MTDKSEIEISIPFVGFYEELFTNSVTIITGCGRSGTSILGKLIGSMNGVEYLFEPTTPKFANVEPVLCRSLMFEDFVLPALQGRNVNIDGGTESYTGYYETDESLRLKWENKRRIDILPKILNKKPQLVLKLTEMQGMLGHLNTTFPGVRMIHIIRNGIDVIQSMMKPNWYTDSYMQTNSVDWVSIYTDDEGISYNVPWFIAVEMDKEEWIKYNHETRCAAVWRVTVEKMIELHKNIHVMKYEDLCRNPELEMKGIIDFMNIERDTQVEKSDITERHISMIKEWEKSKYPNIIDKIQEPEKYIFTYLMKKLNYL